LIPSTADGGGIKFVTTPRQIDGIMTVLLADVPVAVAVAIPPLCYLFLSVTLSCSDSSLSRDLKQR
jgi:hypothetical protein